MIFSRNRNFIDYSYRMGDKELTRVTTVRDLGICLDGGLCFSDHYQHMIDKANRMLGLVLRMSGDFNDLDCVVTLFKSYVRSTLEYGSSIWCPYYEVHKRRIESLQNRFLRYLRFRLQQRGFQVDSTYVRNLFRLNTLEDRRQYLDMCFIFKVINNIIISPNILNCIDFYVPARNLRRSPLLFSRISNTRHAQNMPLRRMVSYVNDYPDIDFVGVSLQRFKSKLQHILLH